MQSLGRESTSSVSVHVMPPDFNEFEPVEQIGDRVCLKHRTNIAEYLFLTFVRSTIESQLDSQENVYLESSELLKNEFKAWLPAKINGEFLPQEQYDMFGLITSIWAKTVLYINNQLSSINTNQGALKDEETCQNRANQENQRYWDQNREGYVFTHRQARFLLETVDTLDNHINMSKIVWHNEETQTSWSELTVKISTQNV